MHPWHKLHTELVAHVFAQWQGTDVTDIVRKASQVSPLWTTQVAYTQGAAFSQVQQRVMLTLLEEAVNEPETARQRQILRNYTHVAFNLVPKDVFDPYLLKLPAAAFSKLRLLTGDTKSIDLSGLIYGTKLFAHWAASTHLQELETLRLDARYTDSISLRALLYSAALTPRLRTIEVAQSALSEAEICPQAQFDADDPASMFLYDFSHLKELRTLKLPGCNISLFGVFLEQNTNLRTLDISGNPGAEQCLLGSCAPGPNLLKLTLSPKHMNPESLGLLYTAPCAAGLEALTFAAPSAYISHLHLGTFQKLKRLDISNHNIDYETTQLPPYLRDLDASNTAIDMGNRLCLWGLRQPALRRLLLQQNNISGLLGHLDLFAHPHLRVLDLSKTWLRDDDIETWAVPADNALRYLSFNKNPLGKRALTALLHKPLPNLRYLDVRMGSQRDAAGLAKVLMAHGPIKARWPKLERLAFNTHWVRCDKVQHQLQDFLAQEGIGPEPINLKTLQVEDVEELEGLQ